MNRMQIEPIQESHLSEVGDFLSAHLNKQISARAWIDSISHVWCDWRPNFGMQLRDGDRLAGVLLAIYSDQQLGGQLHRFCNPHSWCVLPEYRQQSIGLVLAIIKQTGLNFTMLTPNPKVAQVFRALRFHDLPRDILIFPNLPFGLTPNRDARTEVDEQRIMDMLPDEAQRDYQLHRQIPWLHFVAVGSRGDACLVVYKRSRWKRLPSARILHISNRASLGRHLPLLRRHFLFRNGMFTSQVEARLVGQMRGMTIRKSSSQAKLWQSPTLQEVAITNLYSELMSLDI